MVGRCPVFPGCSETQSLVAQLSLREFLFKGKTHFLCAHLRMVMCRGPASPELELWVAQVFPGLKTRSRFHSWHTVSKWLTSLANECSGFTSYLLCILLFPPNHDFQLNATSLLPASLFLQIYLTSCPLVKFPEPWLYLVTVLFF